jgi:DNA-binding response OmpR family regulator
VHLSRLEFELLVKFASDPVRVFSKDELARCIWHCQISGRTVDSHVCRLRNDLTAAGAHDVLVNTWGHGWSLTRPHRQRPAADRIRNNLLHILKASGTI